MIRYPLLAAGEAQQEPEYFGGGYGAQSHETRRGKRLMQTYEHMIPRLAKNFLWNAK